jgi:hypothetical protein
MEHDARKASYCRLVDPLRLLLSLRHVSLVSVARLGKIGLLSSDKEGKQQPQAAAEWFDGTERARTRSGLRRLVPPPWRTAP